MLSSTNSFTPVGGKKSRLKVDSAMIVGSVSGTQNYPLSVHPRRVIKTHSRIRNISSTAPSLRAISSYSEEFRTQRPSFSASQSYREEELLAKLVRIHGTDWNLIARHFSPCGTKTPTELRALWNQYRQTSAITVQQATHFRRKNCYQGPATSLSSHWSSDSENVYSIQSNAHSVVQGNCSKSFAPSPVCPLQDLKLTSVAGSRRQNISSHVDSSVSAEKDFEVWLDTATTPSAKLTNPNLSVKRSCRVPNHRPSSRPRLETSPQKHYTPDHSLSLVSSACSPSPHKMSSSPLPANLHLLEPSQITCISTPLKGAPFASDEHMFAVQTPTKAIGESDLQSFHLVSPPSVFPASASKSGNHPSHQCFPSVPLKPRALFSSAVDAKPARNENNSSLSRVIKAEQDSDTTGSTVCSPRPTVKRSSSPMPSSSAPARSQLSSPFLPPPKRSLTPLFPDSSSSDSIALLTAKATVWNRVQTSKEVNNIMASSGSQRLTLSASKPTLASAAPRARQNSSPFAFPVQQEPQLTVRRILQVASEAAWRRVALGTSASHNEIIQLAHLHLRK